MARKKQTKTKRPMRDRHAGRLERRGNTFIGRWMINGKRFSESTGIKIDTYPDEAAARVAAETWLARRLASVRQYDLIAKSEKSELVARAAAEKILRADLHDADAERNADETPPLLISEALQTLLKSPDYRTPSPQTVKITTQRFNALKDWLAVHHPTITTMAGITHAVAKEFSADLKTRVNGGVFNAYQFTFGMMWRVLADEIKAPSPWAKIRKQEKPDTYRRPLTNEELKIIFDRAATYAGDYCGIEIGRGDLFTLFSLMLFCGARLGDACQMTWESIRFDRGIIVYTAQKTGAQCKPPLMPELRALLERTSPQLRSGPILPNFAEAYRRSPSYCSQMVTDFFKRKCGIETSVTIEGDTRRHPCVTAHSLRHTFISRVGNAGVPLAIAASWVGHLDEEMTHAYFHEDETATLHYAAGLPKMLTATETPTGSVEVIEATTTRPTATDGAESRLDAFRALWQTMPANERAEVRKIIG